MVNQKELTDFFQSFVDDFCLHEHLQKHAREYGYSLKQLGLLSDDEEDED